MRLSFPANFLKKHNDTVSSRNTHLAFVFITQAQVWVKLSRCANSVENFQRKLCFIVCFSSVNEWESRNKLYSKMVFTEMEKLDIVGN